jgi:hypothetical protein
MRVYLIAGLAMNIFSGALLDARSGRSNMRPDLQVLDNPLPTRDLPRSTPLLRV